MMILFVKLTKGIGHKFCQLMKSSPITIIDVAYIRQIGYVYYFLLILFEVIEV